MIERHLTKKPLEAALEILAFEELIMLILPIQVVLLFILVSPLPSNPFMTIISVIITLINAILVIFIIPGQIEIPFKKRYNINYNKTEDRLIFIRNKKHIFYKKYAEYKVLNLGKLYIIKDINTNKTIDWYDAKEFYDLIK